MKPTDKLFALLSPVVEEVSELTRAKRIQIFVLSVVLLLVVFGYFFYYPQYAEIEDKSKELQELDQRLSNARIAARQIDRFRQDMKNAEQDFRITRDGLPDKQEIPALITSISQSGHDVGLEFLLFEPKPEILKDFYVEIPVSVTVSGKYHDVGMFFERISNLPRIVNIKDALILPSKEGNRLITSCTAVTYKFIETPAVKKVADGPKK